MHTSLMASYALSDLRNRKTATALTGVAVFSAALSVLLLGFYGLRVRDSIKGSVDEESLARITVDAPIAAGAQMRFSEENLSEIRSQPGVLGAWGRVDLVADMTLGKIHMPGIVVEGTRPQDSLLAPNRMVLSGSFADDAAHEAILSEALLHQLGGTIRDGRISPSTITLNLRRSVDGATHVNNVELSIVGILNAAAGSNGSHNRVFVPVGLAIELDHWLTGRRSELPWDTHDQEDKTFPYANAYAFQSQIGILKSIRDEIKIDLEEVESFAYLETSRDQWLGLETPASGRHGESFGTLRKQLDLTSSQRRPASTLIVPHGSGVLQVVALERDDPRWELTLGGAQPDLGSFLAKSSMIVDGVDLPQGIHVVGRVGPSFRAGGDLYCSYETFRRLHRASEGEARTERMDYRFDSAASLLEWQSIAPTMGLVTKLFTGPVRKVSRFKVTSSTPKGGRIPMSSMAMIKGVPASHHVINHPTQQDAFIKYETLTLEGSDPQDPAQFASGLLIGHWVKSTKSSRETVLPWKTLQNYFPGQEPREWLGRQVKIQFRGKAGKRIDLQVTVVGASRNSRGYISRSLLDDVHLWLDEQLVYNHDLGRFEDPIVLAEQNGIARCTVHMDGIESLEPLVRKLESSGYHVEHRLGDLKRASSMGRTILMLALGLAAGSLIGGLLSSWITATFHMEAKQREIGVMRSLGMSRNEILGIFAFQGLLVGALVHGLAIITAASIEPDLSRALAQVMGTELQEVLPVRLMSWGALDVHLLGWTASVGFCLLGSTSAAWRAGRIKLSEALHINR